MVAHHTWSLEKEPYFLFVLELKDGNVEKISELEGGVGPVIGVAPSMLVVAVREGEGDTISIIDLQEPLNPKRIDLGINISFHATEIEINEGKAYVAGYGGMAIIDISDKNNVSLIFEKLEHKAKGLSLVGSYVLLHTWNGIQLYETNDLGEVSLVGVFWGFDQITDIAFTEDYLYILDIDGRIFTYLFPEEYKLRKEVVQ